MTRRRLKGGAALAFIAVASIALPVYAQDPLSMTFAGMYGQVEVGGPFAGAEFHESRPLPSRISFFSPVANSIDLSTDYWKRGDSRPMTVGIRVNNGPAERVGTTGWAYTLSPHAVRFEGTAGGLPCTMTYEFCAGQPAMVFRLVLRNRGDEPAAVEVYTHLRLLLRSCQTFARFDSAATDYDTLRGAVIARFEAPATRRAACFVQNGGLRPAAWTTGAAVLGIQDDGGSAWFTSEATLRGESFSRSGMGSTAAVFVYRHLIGARDSAVIVQIIGSCPAGEARGRVARLAKEWKKEVARYDALVRKKALDDASFVTGDPSTDRSAAWARALLATNAHHINGLIVPMPCPAEYNFFFTHDLLLTDLGAVNFDIARVRRDLNYVASLARDSIIPHAYYWRDNGFKTEYCTPDNWNHLWFVIAVGTYLRHSLDNATGRELYPLVSKSIGEILRQRKGDNLMYGFRPDWWDIGHIEGPRAFLTLLSVRALREYVAISARLGRRLSVLKEYETIADSMQEALGEKMWDVRRQYLMDRNGDRPDAHYYMGPLLAAAFGLLEDARAGELVATAWRELGDPRIGIRTAMPPDFQTPEAVAFYRFAGDEAGQPWMYINGGVWPHCNAWYAVSLARLGRVDEAMAFVKRTMTLDGIASSPRGHPAMYEYRCSDTTSPDFGAIDKPSFLWAGGFYLYTLYHLFGVIENEWNLSLAGPIPSSVGEASYSFAFGTTKRARVSGSAPETRLLRVDGAEIPSVVLPLSARRARRMTADGSSAWRPHLVDVNAILRSVEADSGGARLAAELVSFEGHAVRVTMAAGGIPTHATVNGRAVEMISRATTAGGGGGVITMIRFRGSARSDRLVVEF